MSNKLNYVIYARKSTTDERQALSIQSQVEKAQEFFSHLNIVEVITEERSAFKPHNRPKFQEIVDRIENGEINGIIAWHPDRLSRNEVDAASITYLIRQGKIKDLKFGSYTFDNSPEGILMLQMALNHSQYYSTKLGRDVKRGLEKKINQGWYPSTAPAGYLNTPDKLKGERIITIDPDRFELIRKMWDLMLTGNYTPMQILKIANEDWGFKTLKRKKEGGKAMARSTIYKIFTNPFYTGIIEYAGQEYPGSHKPMVSKEEFDRVQVLLGKKGKHRPHRREFAFTGLIKCKECRSGITAEAKNQLICSGCKNKFAYENKDCCPKCKTPIEKMKNPKILNYIYYHCSKKKPDIKCTQGSIKIEDLELQIDNYLSKIQINQKYLDWSIKYLKKAHKLESQTRSKILDSQQKDYKDISSKLDRLLEMRLNGELTKDEYENKKQELLKQKEHSKELLQDTEQRQEKWLELSERTFTFSRYAKYWFSNGDLKEKRQIFSALGQNLTLKDGKLNIEAAKPFSILEKGLADIPEAKAMLEPEFNSLNKEKRVALTTLNPRWLGERDSNPRPTG